jgi:putative heme transporter
MGTMTSSRSATGATTGESARRTRRYVTAAVVVGVIVLLAVEAGMVRPELRGFLRTIGSLWRVDVGWVAVAVLAAPISMSMFALTRRRLLLAAGTRVSARSAVAAAYVANSLHATLPGGVAFSTGYTYRWMRGHGVSGLVATWCLAAGGLVSTAALVSIGVLGSVLAGGQAGWLQLALVIGGTVLLTAAARHLTRDPRAAIATGRWVLARVNRLRRRPAEAGLDGLAEHIAQLRSVHPRGRDWAAATGYALLNWTFDLACLAACAAALHLTGLTLPLLLVAYTAGMATAGLSPLPGGLGVVDAALVLTLVAGGIPAAAALPAVVLYRLISLVGTVAAGWIVWAARSLRPAPPVAT